MDVIRTHKTSAEEEEGYQLSIHMQGVESTGPPTLVQVINDSSGTLADYITRV